MILHAILILGGVGLVFARLHRARQQASSGSGRIRASTSWPRCCPTPTAAPAGCRAAARSPSRRWRARSRPSECTVAQRRRRTRRSPRFLGVDAGAASKRVARLLCAGGTRRRASSRPSIAGSRPARRRRRWPAAARAARGAASGSPTASASCTFDAIRDERDGPAGGGPGQVHGVRRLRGGVPARTCSRSCRSTRTLLVQCRNLLEGDDALDAVPRGVHRLRQVRAGRGAGADQRRERRRRRGLRANRAGRSARRRALPDRRDRVARRRAVRPRAGDRAGARAHEARGPRTSAASRRAGGAAVPRHAAQALDGSGAVVAMETAASEAAGAYPITPSTQMGEGWAAAVAEGKRERERPPAALLRARGRARRRGGHRGHERCPGCAPTNFSSGQGIAYMHESLYAAVGKRLTYVLNVAARAMTKHALNVHAGHDDYHAVDDTGFFQLFAKDVQEAADLNLIAHRIAELSLNPGICAQDGFLTSHVIESLRLPERDARQGVPRRSGRPDRVAHAGAAPGVRRHAAPHPRDVRPRLPGDARRGAEPGQLRAGRRRAAAVLLRPRRRRSTDRAFDEFAALTGRRYARATGYRLDDAE